MRTPLFTHKPITPTQQFTAPSSALRTLLTKRRFRVSEQTKVVSDAIGYWPRIYKTFHFFSRKEEKKDTRVWKQGRKLSFLGFYPLFCYFDYLSFFLIFTSLRKQPTFRGATTTGYRSLESPIDVCLFGEHSLYWYLGAGRSRDTAVSGYTRLGYEKIRWVVEWWPVVSPTS